MKTKTAVFFAIFCFVCSVLIADSSEERLATAAEKAFFSNTWKKILDLLPPASAEVEKKADEVDIPQMLGVGQEKYPLSMYFSCRYEKKVPADQAFKLGVAMAEDVEGMEKMNEEINRLTEELQKVAMSGDTKKMKEIQDKMQAAIMNNAGMAKADEFARDQKKNSVEIDVAVNAAGADFYPYKKIAAPALADLAIYREKTEDAAAETVLFFGPYKLVDAGETLQVYAERKPADSGKVHYLYISLRGEPEVCRDYLQKINFKGLKALVE